MSNLGNKGWIIISACCLIVGLIVGYLVHRPAGPRIISMTPVTATVTVTQTASPSPTPTSAENTALTSAITQLESTSGKKIGVAIAPVGATTAFQAGSWNGGSAWSTIYVPLSVAASRANKGVSPTNHSDVFWGTGSCTRNFGGVDVAIKQAIAASDDCAAYQLWEGLNTGGGNASSLTNQVLSDAGDTKTKIGNPPPLSVQWTLADQATFAAHLPALQGADSIWNAISLPQTDGTTGMGLAAIANFRGKVGQGTDQISGGVTRQFGVLPVGNGKCSAIAIGVNAANSYDTLASITNIIRTNLSTLPQGDCPAGM